MQDSSVLADEVLKIDNDPSQEFRVFSSEDNLDDNSPPINMLFSKQLFELIYSKDVFNGQVRTEGSFTNARAMAQLRQYYLRMLDLNDSLGLISHWDTQLKSYVNDVTYEALNKEVSNDKKSAAASVVERTPDADNEVIKRLI